MGNGNLRREMGGGEELDGNRGMGGKRVLRGVGSERKWRSGENGEKEGG